jgi:glycosyltransferase involved in cell wall biosynthesis
LVIAGEGKAGSRLRSLADACLPGRVRFLGKVARGDMNRFYSAGDIFVFPGIRESLGMVYLEAQSCHLPVVAFDNGGVPEVVRNRETGFLVPAFAFDAFTDAIERLVAFPDLRRQMGRRAACYVHHRHDLVRNYGRLETLLQSLVRAPAAAESGGRLGLSPAGQR